MGRLVLMVAEMMWDGLMNCGGWIASLVYVHLRMCRLQLPIDDAIRVLFGGLAFCLPLSIDVSLVEPDVHGLGGGWLWRYELLALAPDKSMKAAFERGGAFRDGQSGAW